MGYNDDFWPIQLELKIHRRLVVLPGANFNEAPAHLIRSQELIKYLIKFFPK